MMHTPVLLSEVIERLSPKDGELYIDATFGGGGYTCAILNTAKCQVIGVDRDPLAIARAQALRSDFPGLIPIEGVFSDIKALSSTLDLGPINGIVFDLGVSSFQIDTPERGFSFMQDGPLDMRMDYGAVDAAMIVNTMSESDLARVIYRLGEEPQARKFAHQIMVRRKEKPFTSTLELANFIEKASGGRKGKRIHPATKVFQALRMFINNELNELAKALLASERLLAPAGRLVVVAFHSLEDRLVKQFLDIRSGGANNANRHLPEINQAATPHPDPSFYLPKRKAVKPSTKELEGNPRARSARLRHAIKISDHIWPEDSLPHFDLPNLADYGARI